MKVYLAGASKEIELVRGYMRRLEALRLEVTHDWPAVIDAHQGCANHGVHNPRGVAEGNLKGVEAADIFWLLLPEQPTIGAWVELGLALGVRRFGFREAGELPLKIVISGPAQTMTIFTSHTDYACSSHELGFERVRRIALGLP